jgi:nucleotide-binding universal stress UspA family protein
MYERILVPLDGSPEAEEVLLQVKTLARMNDAEICLMRAVRVANMPGGDPLQRRLNVLQEADFYLSCIQKRLEKEGFRVSTRVRYGQQVEEILRMAERENVDLIAMSTHGRKGISGFGSGSVAKRVLRRSKTAVLLIKKETALAA